MKRDWTPGPILVALCAACVAVGAVWLSYDRWPRGTAHAALWAVLTAACVWRANRNLRAELDAARRLLDAWNSSEARDELAQSPPAGTPTVELYDQDAPWRLSLPVPHDEDIVWPLPPLIQVNPTTRAADSRWLGPNEITWPENPLTVHINPEPMTVAETDRLIGQLQALPGEGCHGGDPERIICVDTRCPGHGEVIAGPHHQAALTRSPGETGPSWGPPEIVHRCPPQGTGETVCCGRTPFELPVTDRITLDDALVTCPIAKTSADTWHLGQPCHVCDAPSTSWVSDRPDPEISDVTFLCDGCYAETMSEEDGR